MTVMRKKSLEKEGQRKEKEARTEIMRWKREKNRLRGELESLRMTYEERERREDEAGRK